MIFVILGSQKFQFNRLLEEIDRLVDSGIINDEIFAQIGYSDYRPQNFKYKDFVNRNEFLKYLTNANLIITHGGTGAIVSALKKGKKVIALPRLANYGEHVDNHQVQLLKQFDDLGLIYPCYDLSKLEQGILGIDKIVFNKYQSNTNSILNSIERFLKNE